MEHNESNLAGARYTRGRRPVELEYYEACESRSAACKREYEIKRMNRQEKELLVRNSGTKNAC
jgi:putative endonuclease